MLQFLTTMDFFLLWCHILTPTFCHGNLSSNMTLDSLGENNPQHFKVWRGRWQYFELFLWSSSSFAQDRLLPIPPPSSITRACDQDIACRVLPRMGVSLDKSKLRSAWDCRAAIHEKLAFLTKGPVEHALHVKYIIIRNIEDIVSAECHRTRMRSHHHLDHRLLAGT